MADLLDANALIALALAEHQHHDLIRRWVAMSEGFALCPVTEGALVRTLLRLGESPITASQLLDGFHRDPRCAFWSDSMSYRQVDLTRLRGHRQVTDAYLVSLAAHHGARLITFDQGLHAIHRHHSVLLGTRES